jgi:hypothetical protein
MKATGGAVLAGVVAGVGAAARAVEAVVAAVVAAAAIEIAPMGPRRARRGIAFDVLKYGE